MDRTIEEMTKTERRKVLASVGTFTIGNSVRLVHWKRASSPVEAGTAGYL